MKMKHLLSIVKVFNPPATSEPQHVGTAWVDAFGTRCEFPCASGEPVETRKRELKELFLLGYFIPTWVMRQGSPCLFCRNISSLISRERWGQRRSRTPWEQGQITHNRNDNRAMILLQLQCAAPAGPLLVHRYSHAGLRVLQGAWTSLIQWGSAA